MGFFHTDDGLLHAGRIAGLLFVLAWVLGCGWIGEFDQLCGVRAIFTAGWCLAFCDKHMPRTFRELTDPMRMIGTVLVMLGLVGQFYWLWSHRVAHR